MEGKLKMFDLKLKRNKMDSKESEESLNKNDIEEKDLKETENKEIESEEEDSETNKETEELVFSTGSSYKAKEYEVLAYLDEEESANRLVELLKYSGISDCKCEFGEVSALYEVYVSPTSYELANNIYKKVLEDKLIEGIKEKEEEDVIDRDEALELEEEVTEEMSELNTQKAFREPTLYDSKEEKYKDNLSSAFTFLICGVIGLVVVLLNDLGVFKLVTKDSSSFITINVILIAMFLLFCGIGVWSLIYSKKLKLEAKEENDKIKEINDFLEENVFKEDIDREVDVDIPDELKFFSRVDYVKDRLDSEFSDYDESLVSMVSEKYIEKLYA